MRIQVDLKILIILLIIDYLVTKFYDKLHPKWYWPHQSLFTDIDKYLKFKVKFRFKIVQGQ